MIVFPARMSRKYDMKIAVSGKDYGIALEHGLTRIYNKPKKILDLCTGTGFAAFKAAETFPLASVDAVDQIPEMIAVAQEKKKERGIGNINFRKGNAIKLDYDNNEFDFILVSNAPVYLSEAVRVLKPEGLILLAYSFGGDSFMKAKKSITVYLEANGLKLLEINRSGRGAYVIGQN